MNPQPPKSTTATPSCSHDITTLRNENAELKVALIQADAELTQLRWYKDRYHCMRAAANEKRTLR